MTYLIREVTDARAMDFNGFCRSFESREAAIAYVNETFDVLGSDDFDGEFSAIVRPKGKRFATPMVIGVVAR